MKPETKSQLLLGVTRSMAKLLEYGVPEEHHIKITQNPAKLFTISIGLLGSLAAAVNRQEADPGSLLELKKNLIFSARFFDSYLQSKLNETLDPYLVLLGSASYYLCDLPGSSSVLANSLDSECPDLHGDGLEDLLLWLLQADTSTYFDGSSGPLGWLIDGLSKSVLQFTRDGTGESNVLDLAVKLRSAVYDFGSPRQLLFGDVIAAVVRKKIDNSSWNALPLYSGLPREKWFDALRKKSFIKELWPAQHLLGKADVLKGESAIVQMPTSAGKTKATELILRSAFLADRTGLAIIIAPFRALCHEINHSLAKAFRGESTRVNELSDTIQADYAIDELLGHQQVLVVTPEKLLYVLRHSPEIANHVGLLVFDEGHQFDSGTRGITYELLLTSLRFMIPERTQKVLISAVISNAAAVGEWLNGHKNVVEGTTLIPTFRSVGFASWMDKLGRIEYVDSRNAENPEFFVPRVIESINLGRKIRERKDRYFPSFPGEKPDGHAIALYLGLKLVKNGSIAVFCGKKESAASVCEKAVDLIERGAPFSFPVEFSDTGEVGRISHLYAENLGDSVPATRSASVGIFSHHGNIPHGIRLAVEHAMRDDLVHFVVCTSTLAQGVNLPIRYLIVSSIYQGSKRIKIRDFHNLIGRAGRAGMHTEGSILFADPVIYDKRKSRNEKWRWNQVKELLEPSNSEPCISDLLSIFDPITSEDEQYYIPSEALEFIRKYIDNPEALKGYAAEIAEQYGKFGFSEVDVERQVGWRVNLISAIESFLLSSWDEVDGGVLESDVIRLAEGTLAYFLADEQRKSHICELFKLLAMNIATIVTEPERRKVYGRTLYGVQESQAIERWAEANTESMLAIDDDSETLDLVWPLLIRHIKRGPFAKCDKPEVMKEVASAWIEGQPFKDLLGILQFREAKLIWGAKRRQFKIDQIVEVCEGVLAFDGTLLVSALIEIIEWRSASGSIDLINRLQRFQKRLKYGLPTEAAVVVYELGFSDRVVSQDLAESLNIAETQKVGVLRALSHDRSGAKAVIEKYPSYFQARMDELLY